MPFYDYVCKACHKHFEKIMTLSEYDRGKVKCPKCGSSKVEQVPSQFYAVTTRKS